MSVDQWDTECADVSWKAYDPFWAIENCFNSTLHLPTPSKKTRRDRLQLTVNLTVIYGLLLMRLTRMRKSRRVNNNGSG